MKVKFISLASGSSGNCYYLGTETYGILIDAGIGIRTIKKVLKDYNILMDSIRAVFITHDHADHIKAVGNLGEKMNIPVYTTARIHAGINRSYCMTEKLSSSVRYLEKQEKMMMEDFGVDFVTMKDAGIDIDIVEDGKTFEENAIIKAKTIMEATGEIALADDSGLEVDYLDGAPGIYSARFLGEDTSYDEKNKYIIEKLKDAKGKERSARFVCAMAVAFPNGEIETCRGTIEGLI